MHLAAEHRRARAGTACRPGSAGSPRCPAGRSARSPPAGPPSTSAQRADPVRRHRPAVAARPASRRTPRPSPGGRVGQVAEAARVDRVVQGAGRRPGRCRSPSRRRTHRSRGRSGSTSGRRPRAGPPRRARRKPAAAPSWTGSVIEYPFVLACPLGLSALTSSVRSRDTAGTTTHEAPRPATERHRGATSRDAAGGAGGCCRSRGRSGGRGMYCGQACRQRAYEQRSTTAKAGLPVRRRPGDPRRARRVCRTGLYQLRCALEDVQTLLTEKPTKAELERFAGGPAALDRPARPPLGHRAHELEPPAPHPTGGSLRHGDVHRSHAWRDPLRRQE